MLGSNAINLTTASNLRSDSDWLSNEWTKFVQYQKDFGKNYASLDELEVRYHYFKNTLFTIANHNLDKTQTFQMGINQFSDLSPEEFQMRFLGSFKQSNVTNVNVLSKYMET